MNVTPAVSPRPRAVPVLVEELLQPAQSYVNLDYEFLYHRPIPAGKGSFVYRDVLTDLFDRGEGRGMAVRSQVEVFDEGACCQCTNRCTTLSPTLGATTASPWTGGPAASPTGRRTLWRGTTSGRPSTCSTASPGTPTWSTWTGPWRRAGPPGPLRPRPVRLWLCLPAGHRPVFPGQPERLRRMYGAMKTVLYPTPRWNSTCGRPAPGQGAFRLVNAATGQAILDRGGAGLGLIRFTKPPTCLRRWAVLSGGITLFHGSFRDRG